MKNSSSSSSSTPSVTIDAGRVDDGQFIVPNCCCIADQTSFLLLLFTVSSTVL